MNICKNGGQTGEAGLLKLYMDLTGGTESQARSVFMFVTSENGQKVELEFPGDDSVLMFERAWNWAPRDNFVPAVEGPRHVKMSALRLPIPEGALI